MTLEEYLRRFAKIDDAVAALQLLNGQVTGRDEWKYNSGATEKVVDIAFSSMAVTISQRVDARRNPGAIDARAYGNGLLKRTWEIDIRELAGDV